MNVYHALTIKERANLLSKYKWPCQDFEPYQTWIETRSLLEEEHIDELLDSVHINHDELAAILQGPTAETLANISHELKAVNWAAQFNHIMRSYSNSLDEKSALTRVDSLETIHLSLVLLPFTIWSKHLIENRVSSLSSISVEKKVVESMLDSVNAALLPLLIKTLFWEFHCYKENQPSNNLSTEDGMLRDFMKCRFIRAEDMLSFFEKYPVIARRVTTKCTQVTRHFIELLDRVDHDFDDIKTVFGLKQDASRITHLSSAQGDTHQQGRSVAILYFCDTPVVYKPRNLEVGKLFNDFLAHVCKDPSLLDLYQCKLICRNTYTYQEYIDYRECTTVKELEEYYERFGQLCAVVYVLSGTDMHFENVVAHSKYPVIVDIETLFQYQQIDICDPATNALILAQRECIDSVSGTALIPIITFEKARGDFGIDVSAFSGNEQTVPYKVLTPVDVNTDSMRFDYREAKVKGAKNIPLIKGETVNIVNYRKSIIKGFDNCLHVLAKNKDSLLSPGGELDRFKNVPVRIVLKATMSYARLMEFSSHPNYSSDMGKLERMLDNVWAHKYRDKRHCLYEVEDMVNGDIPIFFCLTDKNDLFTSSGEVIESYFRNTPLENARRRILSLSSTAIDKQIAQMIVSLGMYDEVCANRIKETSNLYIDNNPSKNLYAKVQENVIEIASFIISCSIIDHATDTLAWNSVLSETDSERKMIGPLDSCLFDGMAGLLLFFIQGKKAGLINECDHVVEMLLRTIDSYPVDPSCLDFSHGKAGILHALALGSTLDTVSDTCSRMASRYAEELSSALDKDISKYDIGFNHGAAGIAKALIDAYSVTGNKCHLEAASELLATPTITSAAINTDDLSFTTGLAGLIYALAATIQAEENQNLTVILSAATTSFEEKFSARGLSRLDLASLVGSLTVASIKRDRMAYDDIAAELISRCKSHSLDDSIMIGASGLILAMQHLSDPFGRTVDSYAKLIASAMIDRKEATGRFALSGIGGYPLLGASNGLSGVGLALVSISRKTI